MKVLITGSEGFIGKNLIVTLEQMEGIEILPFDINKDTSLLNEYTRYCDFVFHLAGINRPQKPEEFMEGNFVFTSKLLDLLKTNGNTCPVLITSSIQADLDNLYGKSKKAGEDLVTSYGDKTGSKVLVYRFSNVFGKWCRPNYNSVVATFCNNIANDLPITINDPNVEMNLIYIDDVIDELIRAMNGNETQSGNFCIVPIVYRIKLGKVAEILHSFKKMRSELFISNMADEFTKKLYATYLSYMPEDNFSYPLKMNIDNRGSFTEIIRTQDRGQISVNIVKPGVTKGNHWHHTKNEKFVVVSGKGVIQFRKVGTDKIINYYVSGNKIEVVDIPTGYTHNIINEGETDLVVFMWCNECYNPDHPDTYYLQV